MDPTGARSLGDQLAGLIINIPNYTAKDYKFGTGFAMEKVAEAYLLHTVGKATSFKLNNSYSVFGEKGLNIGNYKIDALHGDIAGKTGTYFSVKQQTNGGNMVRWDYGLPDKGPGRASIHSHFRFNIRGNTYGSSAQRSWYAPYQFWRYKR